MVVTMCIYRLEREEAADYLILTKRDLQTQEHSALWSKLQPQRPEIPLT
jgi:hypothetical protein